MYVVHNYMILPFLDTRRLLPYACIMTLETDKWPIFSLLDADFISTIKIACVFGSSGNEALLITKDDEVYALGSNCSGCLGLGKNSNFYKKKLWKLC